MAPKRPHASGSRKITLTGERHHNRIEVLFDGRPAKFTYTALQTLVTLILARANSSTGFQQLDPVTVTRVRQLVDKAVGAGAGMGWIETGCGSEYRLTIGKEELRGGLVVFETFFELEATNFIRTDQADALKRICRLQKST